MKTLSLTGIILVVLSIVALAYQGFTFMTREKVVVIGPSESIPTVNGW